MSKKKIAVIVGLLLLIAGLIVVAVIIKNDEPVDEKVKKEEKAAELQKTEEVDINDISKVEKINYTNQYGSFNLIRDEKGIWQLYGFDSASINQYKVQTLLSQVESVEATKTVAENLDNKADYGLDKPLLTIQLVYEDGVVKDYTIGMFNSAMDGYYLNIDGNPEVYFIRIGLYNEYDIPLEKIVEKDSYPVLLEENVEKLLVSKDGEEYTFSIEDGIMEFIGRVQTSECVACGVKDAQLKRYGLDDSAMRVTVKYKETGSIEVKSYTIIVGATDEKTGEYYTLKDGSDMVCSMNASLIERCLALLK